MPYFGLFWLWDWDLPMILNTDVGSQHGSQNDFPPDPASAIGLQPAWLGQGGRKAYIKERYKAEVKCSKLKCEHNLIKLYLTVQENLGQVKKNQEQVYENPYIYIYIYKIKIGV